MDKQLLLVARLRAGRLVPPPTEQSHQHGPGDATHVSPANTKMTKIIIYIVNKDVATSERYGNYSLLAKNKERN